MLGRDAPDVSEDETYVKLIENLLARHLLCRYRSGPNSSVPQIYGNFTGKPKSFHKFLGNTELEYDSSEVD